MIGVSCLDYEFVLIVAGGNIKLTKAELSRFLSSATSFLRIIKISVTSIPQRIFQLSPER